VQELLAAGIDVNILSRGRLTALAFATAKSYIKIVELLLDHEAIIGPGNSWGLLCRVQNVAIFSLLNDKGLFDWKETVSSWFSTEWIPGFSTRKPAETHGKWASIMVDNLTFLHVMAYSGSLDSVNYIFEHIPNIDVNRKASHGLTALFFAVLSKREAMVELLISHGATLNVKFGDNWTLLHLSAFLGSSKIVEALLSHGADASALEISNLTPSLLALQQQHIELSNVLQEAENSQGKCASNTYKFLLLLYRRPPFHCLTT
jgi:ankyrin repeat protein